MRKLALACLCATLLACGPDGDEGGAEKSMNNEAPVTGQAAAPDAGRNSPAPGGEAGGQGRPADAAENTAGAGQGESAEPPAGAPEAGAKPPTEEELEQARRTLAFSSLAGGVLSDGYYALPDALYENARQYLDTWRLPGKSPAAKLAGKKKQARASLLPPRDLFDDAEQKKMAQALLRMDQALEKMLEDYAGLERYVADDRIVDDGRLGRKLGASISRGHRQFTSARKAWLEVLGKKTASSEDALLHGHPLRRQILAARKIFATLGEANSLLARKTPPVEELLGLNRELEAVIAEGGKPPFQAPPALERLYRAFLRQAGQYAATLARGANEGFYDPQRRELNREATECRESYNNFVREANNILSRS